MPIEPAPGNSTHNARYDLLDALRGLAVVMMMAFHFSFDLNLFGYVFLDFQHDPFLLNWRVLIVSLFVGVAGASLALACRNGIRWRSFLRREGILLACALLISAASYAIFPQNWIFFGILHLILVASLLALPFVRAGVPALLTSIAAFALWALFSHPLFDHPWLQWVGLMTHSPTTEDYAPLLPWFGVMLIGVFVGQHISQIPVFRYPLQQRLWAKPLLWLGRHSLLVYMLHQPLFFTLFWMLTL